MTVGLFPFFPSHNNRSLLYGLKFKISRLIRHLLFFKQRSVQGSSDFKSNFIIYFFTTANILASLLFSDRKFLFSFFWSHLSRSTFLISFSVFLFYLDVYIVFGFSFWFYFLGFIFWFDLFWLDFSDFTIPDFPSLLIFWHFGFYPNFTFSGFTVQYNLFRPLFSSQSYWFHHFWFLFKKFYSHWDQFNLNLCSLSHLTNKQHILI